MYNLIISLDDKLFAFLKKISTLDYDGDVQGFEITVNSDEFTYANRLEAYGFAKIFPKKPGTRTCIITDAGMYYAKNASNMPIEKTSRYMDEYLTNR